MQAGFCRTSELGRFILDLPTGKSIENTTFWSARVAFPTSEKTPSGSSVHALRDGPAEHPAPPPGEHPSPLRRDLQTRQTDVNPNPSPTGLFEYHGPIQYLVHKTGYYCVGMPVFSSVKKENVTTLFASCRTCHSIANLFINLGIPGTAVLGYTPIV